MNELVKHENTSLVFAPKDFNQAMQFSEMMCKADLLPGHLKNKPADCFRIVSQAIGWGMDPFAVADKTSVISGRMMFEGQLVSAVINSRGNLKKRLNYEWEGDAKNPSSLVLTVTGTLQGEDEPRTIRLTHQQASQINRNGQMQKNPEQQMCYIGARIWARRHMPEIILGVYTPDEDFDHSDQKHEIRNVTESVSEAVTKRPEPPKKKGIAAVKAQIAEKPVVENVVGTEAKEEIVEDTVEPASHTIELEPAEEMKMNLTFIEAGDSYKSLTFTVDSIKQIKIGGNDALRMQVKGEYTGDVLCTEYDKQSLCESSVLDKKVIKGDFKGVRSTKDETKVFTFVENITA